MNIDKDKKDTFAVGKMTQYIFIKACIYMVAPQQNWIEFFIIKIHG